MGVRITEVPITASCFSQLIEDSLAPTKETTILLM